MENKINKSNKLTTLKFILCLSNVAERSKIRQITDVDAGEKISRMKAGGTEIRKSEFMSVGEA